MKLVVSKIKSKSPFNDNTLKNLSYWIPQNRFNTATADILNIAGQFMHLQMTILTL